MPPVRCTCSSKVGASPRADSSIAAAICPTSTSTAAHTSSALRRVARRGGRVVSSGGRAGAGVSDSFTGSSRDRGPRRHDPGAAGRRAATARARGKPHACARKSVPIRVSCTDRPPPELARACATRQASPVERPERMHRPPSLSLVVPVFNEQERFAEHARELAGFVRRHPLGSELLVVDDGSTDRTVEVVETFLAGEPDLRAKLLRRPHQGKGATVRAGLETAGAEYAGFCDVDLSTPLAELERILAAACMGPVLAIGSRDAPASELARPQHPVREWLGKTYNRAVQLTLTPGVLDTQCGAKVAATALWERILPYSREPHLAWDVAIVALARRLGIAMRGAEGCGAGDQA